MSFLSTNRDLVTQMSDTKDSDSKRDYRATLFLPSTDFPMKAGLPEAEPKWLKRWEEMGLYAKLREAAKNHDTKQATESLQRINLQVRALRPSDQ